MDGMDGIHPVGPDGQHGRLRRASIGIGIGIHPSIHGHPSETVGVDRFWAGKPRRRRPVWRKELRHAAATPVGLTCSTVSLPGL